jgi:hypothetical protein
MFLYGGPPTREAARASSMFFLANIAYLSEYLKKHICKSPCEIGTSHQFDSHVAERRRWVVGDRDERQGGARPALVPPCACHARSTKC